MGRKKRRQRPVPPPPPSPWSSDRRQLVNGLIVAVFTVALGKAADFLVPALSPSALRRHIADTRLTPGTGHLSIPGEAPSVHVATATMSNATATGTNAAPNAEILQPEKVSVTVSRWD